ncbi:MAG: biopolymer transporter ExbD [Roseovarius sp.]|nr:biopolymer transporter ExbD [Roseovarius sp.]|tara:strand:- start:120 stop:506 length:387 start_codon:yes stop_codon:yes gene_type:complete
MRKRQARRKLSMTSLIDVIFLLLLFFMLSSTFSKFAEVELSAAGSGAGAVQGETRPMFLRLGAEGLSLNGREVALDALQDVVRGEMPEAGEQPLLVSLQDGVNAQRLIDLLGVLRGVGNLSVTVLGTS